MAIKVKRTVIIGLGGTGCAAVLNMKRRLIRVYGNVPPMYKFLVFDTTQPKDLKEAGQTVTLARSEFQLLGVTDPDNIRKVPEVADWWTRVPARSMTALTTGAKQTRPLGRLAVFANPRVVYSALAAVFRDARDDRMGQIAGENFEVLPDVVVNIACSVAGGTGGGTFMDMSFLVRSMLTARDKLNAFILLPDIFRDKPATANVMPNTYGALREMDHFLSRSDSDEYSYKLGGKSVNVPAGSVWNLVYLINNTKRNGEQVESLDDILEFIGTGMFVLSGSTGKEQGDIIDNMEALIPDDLWWGSAHPHYSSYGTSEVVYPREEASEFVKSKLSLQILDKLFLGGKADKVGQDVENLIDELSVREDTADQVIDRLCTRSNCRKFVSGSQDYDQNAFEKLQISAPPFVDEVRKAVMDVCEENCTELTASKTAAMQERVEEFLRRPGGAAYAKILLDSLLGRLSQFQESMKAEKVDQEARLKSIEGKYKAIVHSVKEAYKSFMGRKKKVLGGFNQYTALVNDECLCRMEIARREYAISFYASLIGTVKDWIERLNVVQQHCAGLTAELNEDLQRILSQRRQVRSFIHEIDISEIVKDGDIKADADDFLVWLERDKGMGVMRFSDLRRPDVKAVLLEYAQRHRSVDKIESQSIEDVLADMPARKRSQIIRHLDNMAEPLWNYDSSRVVGEYHTEEIVIFGVPDAEKTILSIDEVTANLEAGQQAEVVSTGDPLRIICFKYEAAIPAFIIRNLDEYREEYMKPGRGVSYHIHKDWETKFEDLFPSMSEDENRPWWSLANSDAFNLVKRTGQFYRIRSEAQGLKTNDYWVDLAAGRSEAMKVFLKDENLVRETRRTVEQMTQQTGQVKVTECLQAYVEKLVAMVKSSTREVKMQIEKEIEDIEDYIFKLTNIT